ncbi:MAG: hypothetical protein ACXWQO_19640 [Bdellovibrionota bacterium]
MKSSFRFSEIYLFALLITFLMMWGFVGITGNRETAALALGRNSSAGINDTCRDYRPFAKPGITCGLSRIRRSIASSPQTEQDTTQLLSKIDPENNLKKQ